MGRGGRAPRPIRGQLASYTVLWHRYLIGFEKERAMGGASYRGVTIRMFLVDGTPEGLRLVERMGWTGSFLAFSRAEYPTVRARSEVSQTGVYVLTGPDPEGPRSQRIYIGEADILKSRLDAHQKEKDFWTQGFLLTTKDNSLNKAHVRYLEARLIELSKEADNASLDNGTSPVPSYLSEPEIAEMETYLDNALPLFPIVGVDVFEAAESESVPSQANTAIEPVSHGSSEFPRLYLSGSMVEAEGEDRAKGFLVFSGATGRSEQKTMTPYYEAIRERLINE